jgi:hypothetical protein
MRLLRSLFLVGSAAALSGALAVSAVAAPTTAAPAVRPATVHAHLTARFLSEARAALVKDLNRNHGTAWFVNGPPGGRAGVANSTATSSYNWAGCADVSSTHGTFTKVSGVPGIAPEAQFGSVPFSAASETAAGRTSTISGYSGTNYDMTTIDATDTYDIATVSGLTGSNAFKASWKNSY